MSWRTVMISRPSELAIEHRSLRIHQEGHNAFVPLEDISVLIIEESQVSLTASVLSECAEAQVVVLTVGRTHHPNGILLPYLPHSRMLKVIRAQLDLKLPTIKRLWQVIIQQKLRNQGTVLRRFGRSIASDRLMKMAAQVRSGDADRLEGTGARLYFRAFFGDDFNRSDDRLENGALNYGYAIVRAAMARTLVSYGFLPTFGLFHQSEQNAFNLADDLLEPFRPLVDEHVARLIEAGEFTDLAPKLKVAIIEILGRDVTVRQSGASHTRTILSAVEGLVSSLSQVIVGGNEPSSILLPESLADNVA